MPKVQITKYAREVRAGDEIEYGALAGDVAYVTQTPARAIIWLKDGRVLSLPHLNTLRVAINPTSSVADTLRQILAPVQDPQSQTSARDRSPG